MPFPRLRKMWAIVLALSRHLGRYTGGDCPYRLGDMVNNPLGTRDMPCGAKEHCDQYPESIAAAYLRLTDRRSDLHTLISVLDDRKSNGLGIESPGCSIPD